MVCGNTYAPSPFLWRLIDKRVFSNLKHLIIILLFKNNLAELNYLPQFKKWEFKYKIAFDRLAFNHAF